jgi:hypothetical protein
MGKEGAEKKTARKNVESSMVNGQWSRADIRDFVKHIRRVGRKAGKKQG